MDNVFSHSPDLKDRFSNIKVVFLPVNTTSRLQPLDAGIIKNFKVFYRKSLVKHTLAKINDSSDVVNASRYFISYSVDQAGLGICHFRDSEKLLSTLWHFTRKWNKSSK